MPSSNSRRAEPAARVRPGEPVAAVDLGSNSFHMLIAEYHPDGLRVLDRLRETVQLAAGLGPEGCLEADAYARALACLRRFGERLATLHTRQVRAVGTSALRKAGDVRTFLAQAERELGHPIHVISGAEEARLIYNGVAYTLPPEEGVRLVVDVGGGSTEFVVGSNGEPDALASFALGCVSLSARHFPGGELGARRLAAARTEALRKLEPVAGTLPPHTWTQVVGASGSIRAVASVCERLGLGQGGINRKAIAELAERLAAVSRLDALDFPGLSEHRRAIFPAGFIILQAVFELLDIEQMQVAAGALREGLLLDLVGRLSDHDVRSASVAHLATRMGVDQAQAMRVATTASELYRALAPGWVEDSPEHVKLLEWAARLHEVGLAIAYPGYHRHGAYVLENAELAGFSRDERQRLALIVGAQRKAFPRRSFSALPRDWRRSTRRLAILLRLSVLMNRARAGDGHLPVRVCARDRRLELAFPPGWLDAHPLTTADLQREQALMARADYEVATH